MLGKSAEENECLSLFKLSSCFSSFCMSEMIKDEFFSNLPTDLFGRLEIDGFAIVDDAIDGTLLKSVVHDSAKLEKNMKVGEISTG